MISTAEHSDLAGLDSEMRALLTDFFGSTGLIRRCVLSQYQPSKPHGVNRALLTQALGTFRSCLSAQMSDLLEAYEAEVRRRDGHHPGARMFPSTREHMAQLTGFFTEIADTLLQALHLDVMKGLYHATASNHYLDRFKVWVSTPHEWEHLPSLATAKKDVKWAASKNQLAKDVAFDGYTCTIIIDALEFN